MVNTEIFAITRLALAYSTDAALVIDIASYSASEML